MTWAGLDFVSRSATSLPLSMQYVMLASERVVGNLDTI